MNTFLNNLIIYNGYPLSIIIAVSFHSLILAFLIWLQSSSSAESLELVQPTIIKALFIDENPQVRNQRIIEQRRIREIELKEERRIQQERALEQERQRKEEQERAALRDREKSERDFQQARREELERERHKREDREQKERERTELATREESRLRQEAETNRDRAAEAARSEFELVQSATAIIQRAVQQVWNRPPSARNGMRAILQIQMLPTGELLDVRITETSGDPAFDRAAENAVYSAAPFIELRDLPINIFNANFRTLSLIFQPEDLLN